MTIRSIQAARGLAVLLIVICHSSSFIGEVPGLWQRTPVYLWFRGTTLGVQMFFAISGLIVFRTHQEDFDKPWKVRPFLWNRFRRIYPLYWIYLTLTVWKHWPDRAIAEQSQLSVISSYLLVHVGTYQTVMVQAWTLFDEVQFYVVLTLCILSRRVGLAVLSLWLAASFLFLSPAASYWISVFSPYHLVFGLGILSALVLDSKRRIPGAATLGSGLIAFAALVIVAGPFDRGVLVRLMAGVASSCILLGAIVLERDGRLVPPRWLILLGNASYSIYLVHFMAISAVAHFAYRHAGHLPIPIAAWMLLLIFAGVVAGVAMHYIVERPLLWALGKRGPRVI